MGISERVVHVILLVASCASVVDAHGVLVNPTPRPASGMRNTGAKLQPFNQARTISASGCGGTNNGDPGVGVPTQVFSPGQQLTVNWLTTIAHPADNLNTGVRIAIHYAAGDSFEQNVLTGGVTGSGAPGTVSMANEAATITLGAKTCDYCTIQWIWAASNDGGSYIGCADIAITANGNLPNYNALPSQVGNVLPGVAASLVGPGAIVNAPTAPVGPVTGGPSRDTGDDDTNPDGSPSKQNSSSGDGDGGAIAGAVIGILVGVGLIGFCFYKYNENKPAPAKSMSATYSQPAAVYGAHNTPPPPPMPPAAPEVLPPGWSSAIDPASGVKYYLHAATNTSQWTAPAVESV